MAKIGAKAAHHQIAKYYLQLVRNLWTAPDYALLYLTAHLYSAEDYQSVLGLVDAAFIATKSARFGDRRQCLQDVRYAMMASNQLQDYPRLIYFGALYGTLKREVSIMADAGVVAGLARAGSVDRALEIVQIIPSPEARDAALLQIATYVANKAEGLADLASSDQTRDEILAKAAEYWMPRNLEESLRIAEGMASSEQKARTIRKLIFAGKRLEKPAVIAFYEKLAQVSASSTWNTGLFDWSKEQTVSELGIALAPLDLAKARSAYSKIGVFPMSDPIRGNALAAIATELAVKDGVRGRRMLNEAIKLVDRQ